MTRQLEIGGTVLLAAAAVKVTLKVEGSQLRGITKFLARAGYVYGAERSFICI